MQHQQWQTSSAPIAPVCVSPDWGYRITSEIIGNLAETGKSSSDPNENHYYYCILSVGEGGGGGIQLLPIERLLLSIVEHSTQ